MQTPTQTGTQGDGVTPNDPTPVDPSATQKKDEGTGQDVPGKTPREIELEKKFSASAREAQKIREQNAKLAEENKRLKETSTPSDDEFRQKVPDWDDLPDEQKKIYREHEKLKQQLETATSQLSEVEKEKAIDSLMKTNPELQEENENDFKSYINLPENKGMNLNQIVKAYLYDKAERSQKPSGTNDIPVNTTKQDVSNPGLLNDDQLASLHKNDPGKFMDEMMSGKYKGK